MFMIIPCSSCARLYPLGGIDGTGGVGEVRIVMEMEPKDHGSILPLTTLCVLPPYPAQCRYSITFLCVSTKAVSPTWNPLPLLLLLLTVESLIPFSSVITFFPKSLWANGMNVLFRVREPRSEFHWSFVNLLPERLWASHSPNLSIMSLSVKTKKVGLELDL